jgi:hypothetical protein
MNILLVHFRVDETGDVSLAVGIRIIRPAARSHEIDAHC